MTNPQSYHDEGSRPVEVTEVTKTLLAEALALANATQRARDEVTALNREIVLRSPQMP